VERSWRYPAVTVRSDVLIIHGSLEHVDVSSVLPVCQARRDAGCRSTLLTSPFIMVLSRSFVCVADTSMPVSGQSRPPDCRQGAAAEVNRMTSKMSTRTAAVQKNIAEGWMRISRATPRNQF
jgi:hypothetical protein